MKKLIIILLFLNSLGIFSQNPFTNEEKRNIKVYKKEGFIITFRNSNTKFCPYRAEFNKRDVYWSEVISNNSETLIYVFDFKEKTVSVSNLYNQKYFYKIKKLKIKKDNIVIEILNEDEIILILVKLKKGMFRELKYNTCENISQIIEHGEVNIYSKNEKR